MFKVQVYSTNILAFGILIQCSLHSLQCTYKLGDNNRRMKTVKEVGEHERRTDYLLCTYKYPIFSAFLFYLL